MNLEKLTIDGMDVIPGFSIYIPLVGIPINLNKDKSMKPFDLEKALAGKKVINRKGDIVEGRFIHIHEKNNSYPPLLGITPGGHHCWYGIDGRCYGDASVLCTSYGLSKFDLFMAHEKVKKYIYVRPYLSINGIFHYTSHAYNSINILKEYCQNADEKDIYEIEMEEI